MFITNECLCHTCEKAIGTLEEVEDCLVRKDDEAEGELNLVCDLTKSCEYYVPIGDLRSTAPGTGRQRRNVSIVSLLIILFLVAIAVIVAGSVIAIGITAIADLIMM